jgi:imidazolonepropionase-like amidohydrolase
VAYGLPYGAAMSAITLNAAKAFGLGGEIGSIEPGKTADLVLWNGDPLDTQGAPALILIRGVEQPLTSRQLMLRDRYLKKDDPRPPPYRQ